MTLPLDLVLVRHGESEGNVAFGLSRHGDDRHFTPEFLARHSSKWRLTPRGVEQAHAAGDWLRQHVAPRFDRYYVAEYLRAMETAVHLGFTDAEWRCEFYLREREWGIFDLMSYQERRERYADDLKRRELDTFFWTPPGGESMADLCLRIDRIIETLHRDCTDKRVILVCHGEVMWAFRVRLERMSQERYQELDVSSDPKMKIHNCQVLHYTRRDPASGALSPYLDWMRSVCPWDATRCKSDWQKIERRKATNADLMAVVEKTPRLRSEALAEGITDARSRPSSG
jgi:NAD+ kinase